MQICLASKRGAAWNNGPMTFSAALPNFSSDYQEGAHARVLDALVATNMEQSSGYGTDEHCGRARDLIREACQAPDADVYFLVGGTQTNATVIDAILLPWQGVIAPNTGHINMHEAGIVERGGHKILYALASPANDVTLADLARLTDVFYIGGTKCGSLFGEAVVVPERGSIRQFVTQMKQHGALLAKGRLLGVQFEALFEDGLYLTIGEPAVKATARIREALKRAGYVVTMDSPTNLTFVALDQAGHERLSDKVRYSIWETLPDGRYLARIGTSWATPEEDVVAFEQALAR